MTFAFEGDNLRQELRRNIAGSITFRPQVAGHGPVTEGLAATYVVTDPSGLELQSGTATVSGGLITCAVGALDEVESDYQCRITWSATDPSLADQLHVESFDVVLWPFGQISVSKDDIVNERPELALRLERTGVRLALDASADVAATKYASILAHRARVILEGWVRTNLPDEQLPTGFKRGWVILDRDRLRPVEVLLAIACLYESEMTGREEDDTAALYRHYLKRADSVWRQTLPLRVDRGAELADYGKTSKGGSWRPTRA